MNVWKNIPVDDYKECRAGIRLVSKPSIDKDLNNALKEMLKWLRKNYVFPIRCPIYLFDQAPRCHPHCSLLDRCPVRSTPDIPEGTAFA